MTGMIQVWLYKKMESDLIDLSFFVYLFIYSLHNYTEKSQTFHLHVFSKGLVEGLGG